MEIKSKQYAQSLFDLMKKNGDLDKIEEVAKSLVEMANRQSRVLEVEVMSVRKLDEKQLEDVKVFIKKKHNVEEVVLKNIVDESILGGLRLRVGEEMIDLSIGGKLEKLRSDLKNN